MIKNRFKLLLKKYGNGNESDMKNIENMIKMFRKEGKCLDESYVGCDENS